jgi:hypothetical protein
MLSWPSRLWAEATILVVTLPWTWASLDRPSAADSALRTRREGGGSGSALPTPTSQRWGSWASRTGWDDEAWSGVRLAASQGPSLRGGIGRSGRP